MAEALRLLAAALMLLPTLAWADRPVLPGGAAAQLRNLEAEVQAAAPGALLTAQAFAWGSGGPVAAPADPGGDAFLTSVVSTPAVPATLAPPPPSAGGIDVQTLDMRLGLAMLSQSHGARNNQAVASAQSGGSMKALVIRSGTATLDDLVTFARLYRLPHAAVGDAVIGAPIVIWQDGGLRLGPGEVLTLGTAEGAFLINFGTLEVEGATIRSSVATNAGTPAFRPFVVTAGGGAMQVDGARLEGLGFGGTDKFAGVALMRNAMMPPVGESWVRDSRLEDVTGLRIDAAPGVAVTGNHFHDMQGAALQMRASARAIVRDNIFTGLSPTNAIRLMSGSPDGSVSGNVILSGEKTGIVVREGADGARITGNVVLGRTGGGISIWDTACARIEGNTVAANRLKGIELKRAPSGVVRGNEIAENGSGGIWISDMAAGTVTQVTGNRLDRNRTGLTTATGASIALTANDFSSQLPRILGGDIARMSPAILKDMRGEAGVVLTPKGPRDPAGIPMPDCAA